MARRLNIRALRRARGAGHNRTRRVARAVLCGDLTDRGETSDHRHTSPTAPDVRLVVVVSWHAWSTGPVKEVLLASMRTESVGVCADCSTRVTSVLVRREREWTELLPLARPASEAWRMTIMPTDEQPMARIDAVTPPVEGLGAHDVH